MAAVPLGKLAYLALRQVSKPIANYFKKQAAEHPWFRTQFVKFAQAYYRTEMAVKIRFMGHNPTDIKPINESKAINLGADALGEMIVYAIAAGIVLSEYWKSQEKDKAKAAKVQEDFAELRKQIASLTSTLERLRVENEELRDIFVRTHRETAENTRLIALEVPGGADPSPSAPSVHVGGTNGASPSDASYLSWLRVSFGSVFPGKGGKSEKAAHGGGHTHGVEVKGGDAHAVKAKGSDAHAVETKGGHQSNDAPTAQHPPSSAASQTAERPSEDGKSGA